MGSSNQRKVTPASADLNRRLKPRQRRATNTVELILKAAAELLPAVGLHNLTTNMAAKHANVKISSVYRYFPNKLAIVAALAERLEAELMGGVSANLKRLSEPNCDWREAWRATVVEYAAELSRRPDAAAIRSVMKATPELRAMDLEDNERLAREFADALGVHASGVPDEKLMNVARVVLSSTSALTDDPSLREIDPEVLDELLSMHERYLSGFLDRDSETE